MSTDDLKPFQVSEGEGLSDAEREFMKTGTIPEGFKAPDGAAPSKPDADPVIEIPGDKPTATEQLTVKESTEGEPDDGEVQILDKNGKPHGKNGRFVSHQALYAEREEHKKTKGELQTMREQFAAGNARLNLLYQMAGVDPETGRANGQQQTKVVNPLEEKDVAFTEDPIKAWDQMQRRQQYLVQQLSERDKKIDGVNQRIETQNGNAAVKTWLEGDIRQFVAKQPAFGMAWEHVISSVRKELELGGTPADQIDSELQRAQESFVKSAHANKQSAAALIYALAEARGFKAPEIVVGADGKPTIKPKGPAPGTQQAAEQLNNVKKGQEASATLSGAGQSGGGMLTLSQLAAMSEEDYAAIRKKLGRGGMRQYLG